MVMRRGFRRTLRSIRARRLHFHRLPVCDATSGFVSGTYLADLARHALSDDAGTATAVLIVRAAQFGAAWGGWSSQGWRLKCPSPPIRLTPTLAGLSDGFNRIVDIVQIPCVNAPGVHLFRQLGEQGAPLVSSGRCPNWSRSPLRRSRDSHSQSDGAIDDPVDDFFRREARLGGSLLFPRAVSARGSTPLRNPPSGRNADSRSTPSACNRCWPSDDVAATGGSV